MTPFRKAIQLLLAVALLAGAGSAARGYIREVWDPTSGGGVAWNFGAQTPASYFSSGRLLYRIVTAGTYTVPSQYRPGIANSWQTIEDSSTSLCKFARGTDLSSSPYDTGLSEAFTDGSGNTQWGGNIGGAAGLSTFSWGGGNWLTDSDIAYDGTLSWSVDGSGSNMFEGTALHEQLHSVGVDHDPFAMSPMSYVGIRDMHTPTTYPYVGERRLTQNDHMVLGSIYPESGWPGTMGTLTGTLKTTASANIHKGVIGAFSESTGLLVTATLSHQGNYRFMRLPPGTYTLRAFPSLDAPYNYLGQHAQNLPWTSDGSPTEFRATSANDATGVVVTAGGTTTQNLTAPAGTIQQLYTNSVWYSGGSWGIGGMTIRAPKGATIRAGVNGVNSGGYSFPQSSSDITSIEIWGGTGVTVVGGPYFTGGNAPPWSNSFALDLQISGTATPGVRALAVTHSGLSQRFVVMGWLEVTDAATLSAAAGAANPGAQNITASQSNVTMLQLALTPSAAEAVRLRGLTVTTSGTGNEQTAVSAVKLYRDVNGNGVYDSGTDTQVGSNQAFSADNGTVAWSDLFTSMPAGAAFNLLILYDMNGSASNGQTFSASATALSTTGIDSARPISATGLPVSGGTKTIGAPAPTISLSPTTLTFAGTVGGANPPNQTFSVTNSGSPGTTLNFTAADNQAWCSVAPASGALASGASSTITVSVDITGLVAGPYSATITVSDVTASNNPQTVAVNLTVSPSSPAIQLLPATLTFSATAGGANPADKTFTVTNSGSPSTTLNFSITDNATWLSEAPMSGALATGASSTITVSVNITGLTAGTYNGTITVTDPAASNSPQTVAVTLTVSSAPPTISLSPASMNFTGVQGGANPGAQNLTVTNTGGAGSTLNFSVTDNATWLSETPTSGAIAAGASATVSVSVNTSGLAAGTYNGTVTVTDPAATNSPQTVAVSLVVTAPAPTILRSPASLSFSGVQGGSNPPAQTLTVTNSGAAGSTLDFSVTDGAGWLSESPASGSLASGVSAAVTVSVDITGLAPGTYTATITVADPAASNNPQTCSVTLVISPGGPGLQVSPLGVTFTAPLGGPNPAGQTLTVTNGGTPGSTLNWSATFAEAWLTVSPTSGSLAAAASTTVNVGVNAAGLAAGTYNGAITFTASGAAGSPTTVDVTLTVAVLGPAITLTPSSLTFVADYGGANPAAKTFAVQNSGTSGTTLAWTATFGEAWLSVTPTTGSLSTGASASATVSTNIAGLAAGSYTGTITVTDPAATNSPKTVAVTLIVSSGPKTEILTKGPYGPATWMGVLQGTATDNSGTGISYVELSVTRQRDNLYYNGSVWVTGQTWLLATGTGSWQHSFTPDDGDSYTVQSRAANNASELQTPPTSEVLTYDAKGPASMISTLGAQTPDTYTGTIQGTATDATTTISKVEIRIQRSSDGKSYDGLSWTAVETWLLASGTDAWSYAFTPTFGEVYTVSARATDVVDNLEDPATSGQYTYRPRGPDSTVLTNGYYGTTTWMNVIEGTATTDTGTISRVDLTVRRSSDSLHWDGSGWAAAVIWVQASGGGNWSYAFSTAANGETYTVQSRATASTGEVEAAYGSASFTYDASAPVVDVVTEGTVTPDSYVGSIQGTSGDSGSGVAVVTVQIQNDATGLYWNGTSWVAQATWLYASGTANWVYSFTPVLGETYTITTQVTDAAGNSTVSSPTKMAYRSSTGGDSSLPNVNWSPSKEKCSGSAGGGAVPATALLFAAALVAAGFAMRRG